MSYIFGHTDSKDGMLFADSLLSLSLDDADPRDLTQHNLKIHVLDRVHCIGVAGLFAPCVDTAVEFARLPKERRNSKTSHLELARLLQERCGRYGFDESQCELIYLRNGLDKCELFLIQNGLPRPVSRGFIGDACFHVEFQSNLDRTPYLQLPGIDSISDFRKESSRIFEALANMPSVSAVVKPLGQYHWTRVATDSKHGFVYLASAVSGVSGGSGGGTSMFHIQEPVPGIALFVEDERRGYLFFSGSTDYPVILPCCSFDEFRAAVLTKCSSLSQSDVFDGGFDTSES